jgi:very-short-patch-repair endonuclease
MENTSFVDFNTALIIVRDLNINSVREWRKWIKINKDKKIPCNPDSFYKNSGWVNYKHFFGSNSLKRKNFLAYNDARNLLKTYKLNNYKEFSKWVSENMDKNIPSRPEQIYLEDWISWGDFLSSGNISNSKKVFLGYLECKEYLISIGLNGYNSFVKWYNLTKPNNIPYNPSIVYKEYWISWGDFLSTGNISNSEKKFSNYDECKKIVIEKKFKSINDFIKWSDRPDNIPSRPENIFENNGWISWSDFLGIKIISNKQKGKKYLSYNDAKTYLKNFKLNHKFYYKEHILENNIDFLPKRPEYFYRDVWNGYLDFLGCESYRTSYGERRIQEFLISNKIEFIREKKFKSCVNIKELPFDFYLPDYNVCIEYDGEHHFHVVSKYGGVEYLEKVKVNDSIKTKWCDENKVKLLRIHYLKKSKINKILDDFFLSLSK